MLLALALATTLHRSDLNPFDPGPNPLLMRHPTMNDKEIVFAFGDALWSVPRSGGSAIRLTINPGPVGNPYFSPDGKTIAFSAGYDGHSNVYVMPADGGTPKRLTAHPQPESVEGWTPDGKNVLFDSQMLSNTDASRLFTVPVTGGFPTPLPLPMAFEGSYSPDGKELAYVPNYKWETAWKRYRGGQTYPIWIADLSDSHIKKIPRDNTNDENPIWVGKKVFYLSDKHGPVGLYSYDTVTGTEAEEIPGQGFDLKSASAGPGGIVFEKLGSIGIYNPETHKSHMVPVEIHGDFLQVRAGFKNLRPYLDSASISPSGSRIAITARGWVATAPASKGDVHVLSDQQGVFRREATWSPDGRTIAYLTDQAGSQQLCLYDTTSTKERLVSLGSGAALFHNLVWSPDSSKITCVDQSRTLWCVDVKTGKNTKVDQTIYDNPRYDLVATWSPDSKWLTWARDLENHFNAVFVYNVESAKKTQVTDGLADAGSPIFDRDGRMLYFFASTEIGQSASWLDLSSLNALNSPSSIYAVVLRKDAPNPLQPESDEEVVKPESNPDSPVKPDVPKTPPAPTDAKAAAQPAPKPAATPVPAVPEKPEAAKFGIDLDGIEQRIIALPIPAANYRQLVAGPNGAFFAVAEPPRATALDAPSGDSIGKFSFAERKFTPFASAEGIQVTPDGSKALLTTFGSLQIVPTSMPAAPGQGAVNISNLSVKIDPKAEWASIYHDIWREERILFYSPIMNGIDSVAMEKRYEPFLANIQSRSDLNYLINDMLGELCVGHEFPGGGDLAVARQIPGGLLGADYDFSNNRYRITRIYDGERWNPHLYSPLAQPGVNAKAGEYLLAIDGKDLTEATDVYEALEGKAGRQVKIKLGPTPDGKNSREVVVLPVADEADLRQTAWEEDNRRYVSKMTDGRAGYVHVPDTAEGGWVAFNRYYYAQVGKDGIVVDERFNHGGLINDFMIREMQKPMDGAFAPRYNKEWPTPGAAIYGPKVMLINQFSGSGGDMFPWLFRHEKVGRLIGKRTWGGLIAAFGFGTVDAGHINAPDVAFFDPATNKWDVENWGVSPDEDVELDPYAWRKGHDAQLDAAITEINKELAHFTPVAPKRPPYPDKTKLGIRY
jgi:tricorn protease